MSLIEQRLFELGEQLPPPFVFPKANRVGCVIHGGVAFISGHGKGLPNMPRIALSGKVGGEVSLAVAQTTARMVALQILSTLKQELGSLDRITRVIRLLGMVNVEPGFRDMPKVIDGASDLLLSLFGPAGVHARTAIGVAELPDNIAVEISAEFAVADSADTTLTMR